MSIALLILLLADSVYPYRTAALDSTSEERREIHAFNKYVQVQVQVHVGVGVSCPTRNVAP